MSSKVHEPLMKILRTNKFKMNISNKVHPRHTEQNIHDSNIFYSVNTQIVIMAWNIWKWFHMFNTSMPHCKWNEEVRYARIWGNHNIEIEVKGANIGSVHYGSIKFTVKVIHFCLNRWCWQTYSGINVSLFLLGLWSPFLTLSMEKGIPNHSMGVRCWDTKHHDFIISIILPLH